MNVEELAERYRNSSLAGVADTFVLYRIIGNDLPPRHVLGQSRKNLQFILENEPDLQDCEKRFVVNRIVDSNEESAVLGLLDKSGFPYLHLPFDEDEYRKVPWDIEGVPAEYGPWTDRFPLLTDDNRAHIVMRLYRHKNNYVMHNNGARNIALGEGRTVAKWVLPWDGNCFVTAAAWESVRSSIQAAPHLPYFVVPMARVTENVRLLDSEFRPDASEEPQILFRRDANLEFDPEYSYGRRPKVELLWRLGVPGPWDSWPVMPWDLPCPAYAGDAGKYGRAGWVARLSSGKTHLEQHGRVHPVSGMDLAFKDRGIARVEAVRQTLDGLDERCSLVAKDPAGTCFLRSSRAIRGVLAERLRNAATEALARGPFSVLDKTTRPPSGDPHDYWHPAPYYWPNPLRIPGLPYVRRDGRRVPGTQLYEPLSDRYDRTRLQRLFDDTFVLTLYWSIADDRRCAEHAAELVRSWFIAPETAMNPHLEYAQVRLGHDGNRGSSSGVIEFKDLYYFLDAVRLLENGDWISASDRLQLQEWFGKYLHWLQQSRQGQAERASLENHGTYYDLQVCAIAAYLGDRRLLRETLRDSRSRMMQQFDESGAQPFELRRTNTAHYCCFNLQGWIHLSYLGAAFGEDLWSFRSPNGGIETAMSWLLEHLQTPWPYRQIEAFDGERLYPIYYAYRAHYGGSDDPYSNLVPHISETKPLFFPHDGIMPFWQLRYLEEV